MPTAYHKLKEVAQRLDHQRLTGEFGWWHIYEALCNAYTLGEGHSLAAHIHKGEWCELWYLGRHLGRWVILHFHTWREIRRQRQAVDHHWMRCNALGLWRAP